MGTITLLNSMEYKRQPMPTLKNLNLSGDI